MRSCLRTSEFVADTNVGRKLHFRVSQESFRHAEGGENMAKIYYRWIKAGKMTIEDVPTKWRDKVQEMLEADNK